mmetsp:Transcript_8608/g.17217  ORF Transcript_8608/g.17217 Transcript_8608/m.17217 type:complete len:207 (+) Transcript_8608:312-932(+)
MRRLSRGGMAADVGSILASFRLPTHCLEWLQVDMASAWALATSAALAAFSASLSATFFFSRASTSAYSCMISCIFSTDERKMPTSASNLLIDMPVSAEVLEEKPIASAHLFDVSEFGSTPTTCMSLMSPAPKFLVYKKSLFVLQFARACPTSLLSSPLNAATTSASVFPFAHSNTFIASPLIESFSSFKAPESDWNKLLRTSSSNA